MGMLNKSHRSAVVFEETFKGTDSVDLQNCLNLRELKMSADMLGDSGTATINSIKSQQIDKITFTKVLLDFHNPLDTNTMPRDCWQGLDNALCRLTEGLELEVQIPRLSPRDDFKYKDYLPRFERRGRVRFVDTAKKVVYRTGALG